MGRRIEPHWIDGPAGRLEALLEEPEHKKPRLAAVVCHPHPLYGGTMHNKVVYRIARGLRNGGTVVLRFNFRGVNRSEGEHGDGIGEIEDARAALQWLLARYPHLPFALAGFSFGARVIADLGCSLANARWLMAVGFATSTGIPDCWTDRSLAVAAQKIRKIFIQSTHDQYGPRSQIEALFARLPEPKQLIWVEASDHFFAGGLDALEQRVSEAIRPTGATSRP